MQKTERTKKASKTPVIVTFDIETTPIIAYSWDLYPNALSHDNIIQDWSIICAAWKEVGKDKVDLVSIKKVGDDYHVVKTLRDVLANADIIVGHNIDKFDMKKLNTRLIYHRLPPLPKIPTIDTRKKAKEAAFTSNRMDYLCKFLFGEGKMPVHYDLWLDVMRGSKKAIKKMGEYNKVDVIRNEELYLLLRPYMKSHPHVAVLLNGEKTSCPKCGSTKLHKQKIRVTAAGGKYQGYQCQDCGSYHQTPVKKIEYGNCG